MQPQTTQSVRYNSLSGCITPPSMLRDGLQPTSQGCMACWVESLCMLVSGLTFISISVFSIFGNWCILRLAIWVTTSCKRKNYPWISMQAFYFLANSRIKICCSLRIRSKYVLSAILRTPKEFKSEQIEIFTIQQRLRSNILALQEQITIPFFGYQKKPLFVSLDKENII